MNDKSMLRLLEQSSISFDDLRMKQSVRTTFKLPEEIINLLGIIAGQLGINRRYQRTFQARQRGEYQDQ